MLLPELLQANFRLSPAKAEEIVPLFHEDHLEKDDYFLRRGWAPAGNIPKSKWFGYKDITQWIFTPDYFVADLNCLLFGQPARWNVQAPESSVLVTLPEENYLRISEVVPNWDLLEKQFLVGEERFSGLLVLPFRKKLETETKADFIAMNEALRDRILQLKAGDVAS
ncbi:MAG: hypothetical protein AB8H12_23025 [Lewinella sp.]